ncbi:MAG: glutamate 5-kinase [Bacteroidales bacterium]|nr:glutamate 5-kinase [Bacteroidales bacterium]
MGDAVRAAVVERAGLVVIKVGTNVLTCANGLPDRERMQSLVDQLQRIRSSGRKVVLVSSGAIGAGVGRLGLGRKPTDLPHLQACAAVGQCALIQLYQELFTPYGVSVAQLLLTAGDFDTRKRYLNVRNTILTLWEYDCIPIINENDTVSVAEIKFGDNDHLGAMVANLMQAPLLVLLTNVNGLYTDDPGQVPTAQLVSTVEAIDRSVTDMAAVTKSSFGTGGMRSKLKAARLATQAGSAVIMANGAIPGILDDIFAANPVGTLFLPKSASMPAWKRWIGLTAQPKGQIHVDEGARRAVVEQNRSLLPVGVRTVVGNFGKGDLVSLWAGSQEIARGLSNYSATDLTRIAGLNTEQIAALLGKVPYVELIHRDNLVVTN